MRRRILAESNHLQLYVDLVTQIRSERFARFVLEASCGYARQLIEEESPASAAGGPGGAPKSPRDVLRNLGTFVGLLTFGRDEPLEPDLLDMAEMLRKAEESADDELMERVLPFITRVVRACRVSKVSILTCRSFPRF